MCSVGLYPEFVCCLCSLTFSPVIYTCFGQTRKRDVPETAVTHLCRCLEDMIVLMRRMEEDAAEKAKIEKPAEEPKPEVKKKLSETVKGGKWVWVVDFEDFGTLASVCLSVMHLTSACAHRRRVRLQSHASEARGQPADALPRASRSARPVGPAVRVRHGVERDEAAHARRDAGQDQDALEAVAPQAARRRVRSGAVRVAGGGGEGEPRVQDRKEEGLLGVARRGRQRQAPRPARRRLVRVVQVLHSARRHQVEGHHSRRGAAP